MNLPDLRSRTSFRPWPGRLLALCLMVLVSACTLPPAQAHDDREDWQPPLGRIDDSAGPVWLDRGDGLDRGSVRHHQRLRSGDELVTGERSRVELSIDQHRVRLASRTRLRLLRLGDGRIELDLRHGSIGVAVRPASEAGTVLVRTSAGVIQPLDDGLLRVDADPERQRWAVTTWWQEVRIHQGRDQLQLGRNRRAELLRDGGWRLGSPQPDNFSVWLRSLEDETPTLREPVAQPPVIVMPAPEPPPVYRPPVIVVPEPPPAYRQPPVIVVPEPRRDRDEWRREPSRPERPPEGWMRPSQPPVVVPARPPMLEVHPELRQPERPVERPSDRREPPRPDRIISNLPQQPPAAVPVAPASPPPAAAPAPAPAPASPMFRAPAPAAPAQAASSPSDPARHPLPLRRLRDEVR